MPNYPDVISAIGNTPLIRLNRVSDETGCEILGKAEFLNPGQSVKDRAALYIIRDAERRGLLKPGGTIVEGTAGNTGIGLSQRMQSFVLDPAENPYNVVEPGKRPRATLTPTLALRNGKPWLAFAVQGGDSQEQNLLQFFLNVLEFDMTVQEAAEAANIMSYQMRASFGGHESRPGRMLVNEATPPWVRDELERRGYTLETGSHTSGPMNAILFDHEHGTLWGGSSNHGEDYGIAW